MSRSSSPWADLFGKVISFFIAIWLMWMVYTWVMPQIFPDGPVNLIDPGFWLFFGVIWLFKFVINLVTPKKLKE